MVNNDNALIERLRFEQVIRKYDDGRTLTQKLNPDGNDAANRIEALSKENERKDAEIERLREALREVFEQWAGSEGFIPETAPEGYLLHLTKRMADIARAALGETK